MTKLPIFSIIIPHKNIPDLLKRCLDSIPYRDDIQIIIVDDNSDPSIVDFTQFPGLERPNTEIYFTKEGKGAGYARNVGLDHANGKWLLFADADDYFTEQAFDYLFAYVDCFHEIIYFKFNGDRGISRNRLVDDYISNRYDFDNEIRYRHISPCGKMIRRELVWKKNIRFEEITASNDVMFSIQTGYYASSVGVCEHKIYCITIREGSLTLTFNRDTLITRFLACLRYNKFLRKHNKHRHQVIIIVFFYRSFKYGVLTFFKFVQLAFIYRANPFVGIISRVSMKIRRLSRKIE